MRILNIWRPLLPEGLLSFQLPRARSFLFPHGFLHMSTGLLNCLKFLWIRWHKCVFFFPIMSLISRLLKTNEEDVPLQMDFFFFWSWGIDLLRGHPSVYWGYILFHCSLKLGSISVSEYVGPMGSTITPSPRPLLAKPAKSKYNAILIWKVLCNITWHLISCTGLNYRHQSGLSNTYLSRGGQGL